MYNNVIHSLFLPYISYNVRSHFNIIIETTWARAWSGPGAGMPMSIDSLNNYSKAKLNLKYVLDR